MANRFKRQAVEMPYDVGNKETEIRAATTYIPRKSSRNGALGFSLTMFLLAAVIAGVLYYAACSRIDLLAFVIMILAGIALSTSVHIALSWERAVVLRLGKFNRVAGPGLYFTIPVLEYSTIRIDQRIITTPFYAEKTLTADLVPINIDAVLYWVVRDAEAACVEVEDYYSAISFLAQTAMREAVGRSTVAEVALRRDQLDTEIQEDISREAANWGIDIISVKVRDIVLPDELQDVMSLEAQADREKNARMTVASAETDVAEMLAEAAKVYGDPEAAMKLRTMLMQYDTVKKSKGTVVTVPSAMSDGFVEEAAKASKA